MNYSGVDNVLPDSFVVKIVTARAGDNSNEKVWLLRSFVLTSNDLQELYFYQNLDKLELPPLYRAPKPYFTAKNGRTFVFLLEDICMYYLIARSLFIYLYVVQ